MKRNIEELTDLAFRLLKLESIYPGIRGQKVKRAAIRVAFEKALEWERIAWQKKYLTADRWQPDFEPSDCVAARKLTGISWRDLERYYEYEAATGVFESPPAAYYYEGAKFGAWVSECFCGCTEMGWYKIDTEKVEYQEYLIKKCVLTVCRIRRLYPRNKDFGFF